MGTTLTTTSSECDWSKFETDQARAKNLRSQFSRLRKQGAHVFMQCGEAIAELRDLGEPHGVSLRYIFKNILGIQKTSGFQMLKVYEEFKDRPPKVLDSVSRRGLESLGDQNPEVIREVTDEIEARDEPISEPEVAKLIDKARNGSAAKPGPKPPTPPPPPPPKAKPLNAEEIAEKKMKTSNADLEKFARAIWKLHEDAPNSKWFDRHSVEIFENQLKEAAATVRNAKGYAICAKCHGRGCSTCKQSGWLPRITWKALFPE